MVEPVEGVEGGPELEVEILEWARTRLAKFKTPKSIDFTDEMPRDPNGKLYKRKLRDPYWEGRARHLTQVTHDDLRFRPLRHDLCRSDPSAHWTHRSNELTWQATGMTEIADRYRRLSDAFAATIAGVPDDRWAARRRARTGPRASGRPRRREPGDVPGVRRRGGRRHPERRRRSAAPHGTRRGRSCRRRSTTRRGPTPSSTASSAAATLLGRHRPLPQLRSRHPPLGPRSGHRTGRHDRSRDAERVLEITRGVRRRVPRPGRIRPGDPRRPPTPTSQTRMLAFCGRARVARALSGSSARQRYQLATVRNGRQRSARAATCSASGSSRVRNAIWYPRRNPKSSTGRTSGRPRCMIRNISALQRPIPRTAESSSTIASSSRRRTWRERRQPPVDGALREVAQREHLGPRQPDAAELLVGGTRGCRRR